MSDGNFEFKAGREAKRTGSPCRKNFFRISITVSSEARITEYGHEGRNVLLALSLSCCS